MFVPSVNSLWVSGDTSGQPLTKNPNSIDIIRLLIIVFAIQIPETQSLPLGKLFPQAFEVLGKIRDQATIIGDDKVFLVAM